MTFTDHLGELRSRILYALAGWVPCSVGTWFVTPRLIRYMRMPIGHTELIFTRPTEAFMVYLKVAVIGGLFLSLPWILYQAAAFVMPGLEPSERRWIQSIVPASFVLFVGGATFAYLCVLPVTMHFFLTFQTADLKAMISLSEYIGFITMMLVVCGLIFQTPIVIVILAVLGFVNVQLLRKGRRWAILMIFVIAGIVTPSPDAFTQVVVALPMVVLYEISILLVRWLVKPSPKPS